MQNLENFETKSWQATSYDAIFKVKQAVLFMVIL